MAQAGKTAVEAYIVAKPKGSQKKLRELRAVLKRAAPKAEEGLQWSIPAFSYSRILFTYAAFKNHIGLYPTPGAMVPFKRELARFKTGRGSIRFPLDTPLPAVLIRKIARLRVKQMKEEDAKRM